MSKQRFSIKSYEDFMNSLKFFFVESLQKSATPRLSVIEFFSIRFFFENKKIKLTNIFTCSTIFKGASPGIIRGLTIGAF